MAFCVRESWSIEAAAVTGLPARRFFWLCSSAQTAYSGDRLLAAGGRVSIVTICGMYLNQNSAAELGGRSEWNPHFRCAYFGPAGGVWPKSVLLGGLPTQFTSQAPSTVMKTTDPSEVQCLMLHLGRDVVEAARAKLLTLALVVKDGGPLNHGVGFVRAVPVHGHMHLFGRADQQLRRVGLGIDPENRNLRRIVPPAPEPSSAISSLRIGRSWPGKRRRSQVCHHCSSAPHQATRPITEDLRHGTL
jgi:hypothetical protein